MLQKISIDAAYCYNRAEECRRLAERTSNPTTRRDFEDMETRWLSLARSYDFVISLDADFTASLNTFVDYQERG
jgi:hypothetical protein